MKTKELTIKIPKGQEIDWEESAKQKKIIFKTIETSKPRSWKEYCEQQSANNKTGYFIDEINCDLNEISWCECSMVNKWKNVLPSKELTEAFLAMMQLCSLRESWIGDWKPDWKNFEQPKASISYDRNSELIVLYFKDLASRPLSFPTYEMAEDFMVCFKDLLEIAKPLI